MPGVMGSQEEDQSQYSSQDAYADSPDDEDYAQRPAKGAEDKNIPISPGTCCLCSDPTIEGDSQSAACAYVPDKTALGTAGARFCKGYCRVHLSCVSLAFSDSQILNIPLSQGSDPKKKGGSDSSVLPHHVSCRGFCPKIFGAFHPLMADRLRLPAQALVLRQAHVARLMRSMYNIACGPQTLYAFVVGQVLATKPADGDWEMLHNIQVWIRADGGETLMPVMVRTPVAQHLALLFFNRFAMFPQTAAQRRRLAPLDTSKLHTLRYLQSELKIEQEASMAETDVAPWPGSFVQVNLDNGKTGLYPIDAQGVPLCNAFDTDDQAYPLLTQQASVVVQGKFALQHAMNLERLVVSVTHHKIVEGMATQLVLEMQAAVNAKTAEQAWMNKAAAKEGARLEKTRHEQARKGHMAEASRNPFDPTPLLARLAQELGCSSAVTKERFSDIKRYLARRKFFMLPGGDLVLRGALSQEVGRQEVMLPCIA
jgi:hypothetical protein